jgi:prolipoprotein diacylglyceryltransferase
MTFGPGQSGYSFQVAHHLIAADAPRSLPAHPLQLYFVAAALLITAAARWLHPRKRYDGQIGLVGLVLFAAMSAVLEPFRADWTDRAYWGPLPQLTWSALGLTALALTALLAAEMRHRNKRSPSTPVPVPTT